jgi:WD40 repeat protein
MAASSNNYDKNVKIWNWQNNILITVLKEFSSEVCSLAFATDSKLLAAGS